MSIRILETVKDPLGNNFYSYDDPVNGCADGEEIHAVIGAYGYACMPQCPVGTCPGNVP
jgi:hypothetical protein